MSETTVSEKQKKKINFAKGRYSPQEQLMKNKELLSCFVSAVQPASDSKVIET